MWAGYLSSIEPGIHHLAPLTQDQRSHNPRKPSAKLQKTRDIFCLTNIPTDLKARETLSRQKTTR